MVQQVPFFIINNSRHYSFCVEKGKNCLMVRFFKNVKKRFNLLFLIAEKAKQNMALCSSINTISKLCEMSVK